MKIISLVICSFLSTVANAQQSHYIANSKMQSTKADFSIARGEESINSNFYQGDVQKQTYQIKLSGLITDTVHFRGGVAFVDRKFANEGYKVTGLSNLDLGAWMSTDYEAFNLNYGVDTSLSMAAARFETSRWRNNFSGYNSYSAFLGSDWYVGKVMAGVRGAYSYFQSRFESVDDNEDYFMADEAYRRSLNYYGLGADAFVEVPMHKNVTVGISAGTLSLDRESGRVFKIDGSNTYHSQIYGNYKVDAETNVILGIEASTQRLYENSDATELSLGVSRAL